MCWAYESIFRWQSLNIFDFLMQDCKSFLIRNAHTDLLQKVM
jgi:hypothetical protein